MVVFPFCKINLGLHIKAKRTDGFHDIETIFYPVYGYSDVLEIIRSNKSEYSFQQKGIPIKTNHDIDINLVEKAYLLLREKYHLPSVDMFLYKNIPVGAGLGGSSSDATFTLKLLDTIFSLHLDNKTLKEYATQLGSDCPFFIDTVPAIGTNRGNKLVSCSIPQLSKKYLVIVTPNIFISTAEAYKSCKPYQRNISLLEIISQPISCWKDTLTNDFEKTIFPLYPELQSIKENFYHQGAIYASLTGSGSSLYGIFKKEPLSLELNPDYFLYQGWLF
ncbi:MAG: 4-(cytidine 5'-diphospho)-2-C-methyl-D-erythritol kinase [Bacteroidales bacterium]|jgi:4-diphosphocytidyl-2-C-methyl-D-erythritol kinase|nr:4-(cytidine 5'-diphospho)-2-C-methyl-D-erythritol kinase [Bacteroidales bacterium]